jgi:hypothetical protein
MRKILLVLLFASMGYTYSQTLNFLPRGLSLEVGFGYNELKHQEVPLGPFYSSQSFVRDAFKLTPTFRISWEKEFISNFSFRPFISYSIMGGKSKTNANGYVDDYTFKTLSLGLFASYKILNVSFSAGSKYNRFLNVSGRFYGGFDDPAGTTRVWNEVDMSDFFKKYSFDLGGRVSYSYLHFILAGEGWFSISELSSKNLENYVNVSSKRFQLLIGYQL